MGLQNELSDVSSESILILTVVIVAKSVRYLQSLLFTILHAVGSFSPRFDRNNIHFENSPYDVVGSRLAGIVLLCEQLNLNRVNSYPNRPDCGVDRFDSDCVVCLNRLGEGDLVRKLACRHAFHKDCLDGWLGQLNFNCPLCRARLVSDERVEYTRRRVAGDLMAWFPFK
ncbi:hypothetical protein BUALT_Bualt17G0103900 [Buddleja alternifolia]|uniref:RING-type domain-containing protein n=1 Tax=Buddleja alternifolia TaxID=168488 RepID=A0AAV6WE64_9LAMI|nr:hypothetical protein BUALT_Bualt17G0103900 [Buddleja alternifolia]